MLNVSSNTAFRPWWQSPWLLILRLPLAGLFWMVTEIRNLLYDWRWLPVKRVPAVVISVGNLSAGGSGKTLLVEAFARKLIASKYTVGIVSRGYKRTTRGIQIVADGWQIQLKPETAGDEPFLLALNLPTVPIMVGEDKAATAEAMVKRFGVQIILLDDGFQHRRLYRDMDCVILNATPDHPGNILPLGDLRESRRQLRRGDLIFYTKLTGGEVNPTDLLTFKYTDQLLSSGSTVRAMNELPGRVGAFCGIGNPDHFFSELHRLGVKLEEELIFQDHCAYDNKDRARLDSAGNTVDLWITTQKDWVKLPPDFIAEHQVFYLPVEMEIHPEKWAEVLARVESDLVR